MEEARDVHAKKRRRRLLALLLLVLVPLGLVGGAWLFLQSGAGEALVRAQVLDAARGSLAGRLEAKGLQLSGHHLVALGLELFTPEGELVASIARLEADVDLAALASQRLHLARVSVQSPKLFLKEDERGWNLSRALAAKAPPTPTPPGSGGPNRWVIEVEGLTLLDGLFDLEQEERRLTATQLAAQGNARVRLEPLEVTSELSLHSQLTAPLEERLEAELTATPSRGPQQYAVRATLGGTKLRGRLELPQLAVELEEVVAAPRELTAFVPGWPLQVPLHARGGLSPTQAVLELQAGRGKATLDAQFDLDARRVERARLKAEGLDLKELVGAPLESQLDLDLEGAVADWRLETLEGRAQGHARWETKGQPLARARLAATASKGAVHVQELHVQSPGVVLAARGTASPEVVSLNGALEAKDLSQLARTLRTFAGLDVPGLAGQGQVQLSVVGPVRGPAVKAVGRLQHLSVAGLDAEQLDLDVDLPNLLRPLDADALLSARRIRFGERAFDEVKLEASTHGRELDVDLSTKGLGDLRIHAVGRLDADSQGAELQQAELVSAEARWGLEAPTHVTWAPRVAVAPFTLRDGAQGLSGRLELERRQLDAAVRVEKLDLARLPRILALPSLGLAGTLTGEVNATGKLARPTVSAVVSLRGGQVREVKGLDVDLKAGWRDERAVGTLEAKSPLGAVAGTFDLPVRAFLREQPVEGSARLTLEGVSTAALARQLQQPLPVDGVVSGVLELSGTGAQPKVRVRLEAPELAVTAKDTTVKLQRVALTAGTNERDELGAELEFTGLGGAQALRLETPLTVASLRGRPPDREALLALPVKLGVELRSLDLHQLHALGLVEDERVAGTVAVNGALEGSAQAPRGQLTVDFGRVTYPPVQRADGRVTVRTDDAGFTALTADLALGQRPALALTAKLSTLPERALRALLGPGGDADALVTALADVPFELHAAVEPFELGKAVTAAQEDHASPGGLLSGTVDVGGTLEAPTARVLGTLKDLRFDRAALGSARFDLGSTPTEQRFNVALGGQGRDDFKAKGTTGVDLRLSSLRRGLKWSQAPVDLTLEARNFDLGFLSGSTELLRVVAGRLDLSGRVRGTLGAPMLEGDATVRDGRLALAGNGDYRHLQLKVHVDDRLFELSQLEVKSGAGSAQLVARAQKQPSGVYLLTSSGTTDRFPIVNDDQLLANATLKYALEGDVSAALFDIRKLSLPRVEVGLPEVKRKDLQDLERPGDIIVLRGGKRPGKRPRAQAQEAAAAQQKEGGLVVRAVLDAPRNLWVRSSDVNIELGLSEGFRVEYRDGVRLFGEGRVVQGQLEVIGRDFTVQKGSEARFAGAAARPYVNVTALHVNTREQVKITVTVAGRGADVTVKATSEPPMPESDIYAVLATGRRTLKTSGGATFTPGQAASVVGQLASSQIKAAMAKALPIDVFNFETSDNFEKFKLDVGKYLSDSVYLGGSLNIGARRDRGENVWSGRLELQVTRAVSLEAYAGDALSFGADAMWSRDF